MFAVAILSNNNSKSYPSTNLSNLTGNTHKMSQISQM